MYPTIQNIRLLEKSYAMDMFLLLFHTHLHLIGENERPPNQVQVLPATLYIFGYSNARTANSMQDIQQR